MKLLYFADPMCSWCYGFSPSIQTLAEKLPVEVIMGGLRAGETRQLNAAFRTDIQNHWQHVQDASGQPFDFENGIPEGFVYNTEPACRAVVAARSIEATATLPILDAIHRAFYAKAQDVTQTSVLTELAGSVGLDRAVFQQRFESAELKQQAADDFERARDYGVSGFPTLILQMPERAKLVSIGYEPLPSVLEKLTALAAIK